MTNERDFSSFGFRHSFGFRVSSFGLLEVADNTGVPTDLVLNESHFRTVVLDGICAARVSIDIMTADFKAMLVPDGFTRRARSIVQIFRKLADRGVEIRLLHAGVPSSAALIELRKELPASLTIRRCPRLHSKAVIIDSAAMYLGSANLTGAGLGAKGDTRRNFELGIWTGESAWIDRIGEEFNQLWEGRHCKGCGRREVCPVPLEEPRLLVEDAGVILLARPFAAGGSSGRKRRG